MNYYHPPLKIKGMLKASAYSLALVITRVYGDACKDRLWGGNGMDYLNRGLDSDFGCLLVRHPTQNGT